MGHQQQLVPWTVHRQNVWTHRDYGEGSNAKLRKKHSFGGLMDRGRGRGRGCGREERPPLTRKRGGKGKGSGRY